MNKIKSVIHKRHGMDQLNIALLTLTLILCISTFFVDSKDLKLLCWFPFLYCIFRMASRRSIIRYKENVWFLKLVNPMWRPIYVKYGRKKDKQHKYCQCPTCNQTIRIERQVERPKIICPICKSEVIK